MRRMLVASGLCGLATWFAANAQGSPAGAGTFAAGQGASVLLSTWYGRALFQHCDLSAGLRPDGTGHARLSCDPHLEDGHVLRQERELRALECVRLAAALRAALPLPAGPGGDGSRLDGVLQVLLVRTEGGMKVVATVASLNPQFERDGPAKELLTLLGDLHRRLHQEWVAAQPTR